MRKSQFLRLIFQVLPRSSSVVRHVTPVQQKALSRPTGNTTPTPAPNCNTEFLLCVFALFVLSTGNTWFLSSLLFRASLSSVQATLPLRPSTITRCLRDSVLLGIPIRLTYTTHGHLAYTDDTSGFLPDGEFKILTDQEGEPGL